MRFRDFLEEIYIEDGVSIVHVIHSINSYYAIANSTEAEGKFEICMLNKENAELAMKNKGCLKVLREQFPEGWRDYDEFEVFIEKRLDLRNLAARIGIPWKEGTEGSLAPWKENSRVKQRQNSQNKSFFRKIAEKLGIAKENTEEKQGF